MDSIQKFLKKLSTKERFFIIAILRRIRNKDLSGLKVKKLKGYAQVYRVRLKQYRIIYKKGFRKNTLITVTKRDNRTYKNI